MTTKVKELRLPIVITADGTKAVAGMRQFQTVGKRLNDTLGKYASSQVSDVGGMLMGYLGIDAAISGMRKLYEYADKIQGFSRNYSPAVSAAYGERRVAEHRGDKAAGLASSPLALEREQLATRMASAQVQTPLAQFSEGLALTVDQYIAAMKLSLAALVTGGQEGANLRAESNEQLLAALGIQKGGVIDSALSFGDTPAQDIPNAMQAQTLAELQAITRALRGNK
jgi:hypothetical protein